jgi:tetratricopeptide (TPR) repeat protein
MRRILGISFCFFLFACAGTQKRTVSYIPPVQKPSVEENFQNMGSEELPVPSPVNPDKLDLCTRHLLFSYQYVMASDYGEAEDEVREASKYCSSNDPRFLYVKALLYDIRERKEEAYKFYYKAAKEYIKRGDLDGAFKCYSGMVSINPEGKEVRELKKFFEDQDY